MHKAFLAISLLLGGSAIYGAAIEEPDELTPIRPKKTLVESSPLVFGNFQAEQYKTLWSLRVPFYRKVRKVALTKTANGLQIQLEDSQLFQFKAGQLSWLLGQIGIEGITDDFTVTIKFSMENDIQFIDEMHLTIGDEYRLLDGKVIHLRNFTRIE